MNYVFAQWDYTDFFDVLIGTNDLALFIAKIIKLIDKGELEYRTNHHVYIFDNSGECVFADEFCKIHKAEACLQNEDKVLVNKLCWEI